MNPTTQQLRALGYDVAGGKAVPAAADKPRARRFTGRTAQWKKWLTEQQRGPGVFLPIRTFNESNQRCHWSARSKRAKEHRNGARTTVWLWGKAMLRDTGKPLTLPLPATVTLTRYGPRKLDSDGLQSAMKATRDGVADAFGTNDGPDGGLKFEYGQEVAKHYGVRIEVATGKDTP